MTENEEVYDQIVKITLIGDPAVGKSNLLLRFASNEFDHNKKSTVGVEVGSKIVTLKDGSKVKLIIWDTAGQEKYKAITNSFYNNSKGAIVVFDVTKESTLKSVIKWIEDYKIVAGNSNIIIVGNKKDLENNRELSETEGKEFVEQLGYLYAETSALTGENVEEVFDTLVDLVNENYLKKLSNISDDENLHGKKLDENTNKDNKDSSCSC